MKFIPKIAALSIFPLFAFPLFKENISILFFIIFSLFTIIHYFQSKLNVGEFKKFSLHFIPFFIVLISSLFFSIKENLPEINKVLLFLLMPIIFYIADNNFFTEKKINHYLNFMIIACLVLIVFYITLFYHEHNLSGFFRSKRNSSFFRDFIYDDVKIFNIHPAYFTSVLLVLSAFLINELKKRFNVFYVLVLIIFYVFTFLALTKLNLILLNLLIFYAILFYYKSHLIFKITFVSLLIIAGLFFINNTPGLILRIEEVINSFNTVPVGSAHNSTNVRQAIYTCDLYLIKENFIFGTGFSNIKLELMNCFQSNYDSTFFQNNRYYLTHNYFFYIFIGSGFVGLLVFIFYLYSVFKILLKLNSFVVNVFMINTFFMLCIEDYFYRQNGVYFFLLFALMYYKLSINKSKIQ